MDTTHTDPGRAKPIVAFESDEARPSTDELRAAIEEFYTVTEEDWFQATDYLIDQLLAFAGISISF